MTVSRTFYKFLLVGLVVNAAHAGLIVSETILYAASTLHLNRTAPGVLGLIPIPGIDLWVQIALSMARFFVALAILYFVPRFVRHVFPDAKPG